MGLNTICIISNSQLYCSPVIETEQLYFCMLILAAILMYVSVGFHIQQWYKIRHLSRRGRKWTKRLEYL